MREHHPLAVISRRSSCSVDGLLGHVVPAVGGGRRSRRLLRRFRGCTYSRGDGDRARNAVVGSALRHAGARLTSAKESRPCSRSSGGPDIISFAGGLPDPRTFPRERVAALMAEFAESGEASAFQYAPTRGLPGLSDVLAARLESMQDRRPAKASWS